MANQTKIRAGAATDVGPVRRYNEDSYLVDEDLQLYVVADGMGGHAAGDVASELAVATVRDHLRRNVDKLKAFEIGKSEVSRRDVLSLMEAAVQHACASIYEAAGRDVNKRGMGTTLTAALIVGNRAFIGHVGDSRAYLCRRGELHQLTEDHSVLAELLKRGRIVEKDVAHMPFRNAVTRAVGVHESVDVDTLDLDILVGDRLLLSSDGLHAMFESKELVERLNAADPAALAAELVKLATERGSRDNATAVVVVCPEGSSEHDAHAREVELRLETLRHVPMFRYLDYQELVRVVNITQVRSFDGGLTIVREADRGEELFIVLEGRVRVLRGESEVSVLGPGQHFGEMALIDNEPRSATVISDGPSRLMVIRRTDFYEIIRQSRNTGLKLLWSFVSVLSQRLRATTNQVEYLHRQTGGSVKPPI